MGEGGKIAASALEKVLEAAKPGATTLTLNNLADDLIRQAGAYPAFKGLRDFPFAACINVNEGVVHGLPSKYKLKKGDFLSLDLGVYYKGLYTDAAWTVVVGGNQALGRSGRGEKTAFLDTGKKALSEAIAGCRVGNRIGDVSHAIQAAVEQAGFSVVRDLVGHGVGRKLHEEPQVPCFGRSNTGPVLDKGMTLAIEVIYALGSPYLELEDDGWTIRTRDGSLAGLFEHSVAITSSSPIVLTARGGIC